eukprot:m.144113 g.144113  ORF g.144113 m.144113 type:complete len:51 (-) comp14112_c0_seq3:1463-1615(-)
MNTSTIKTNKLSLVQPHVCLPSAGGLLSEFLENGVSVVSSDSHGIVQSHL